MMKVEKEDCLAVIETAGKMIDADHQGADGASLKKDRNKVMPDLLQFQRDLDLRMAGRPTSIASSSSIPKNVQRTGMVGSILDPVATCLSDGDDEENESRVSEMMLKISNHYETSRQDVGESLKAFQLDIDFVKNSEGGKDDDDDDVDSDEDFSEALSFAEDSKASPSPPKAKYDDIPSTATTRSTSTEVSFPPPPPFMDYSRLSLKALKVELEGCGVSAEGFLEKEDFIKALEDHKQAESENNKSIQSPVAKRNNTDSPEIPIKYITNEKVLYASSNGEKETATIVKVHLDNDLVPFYDIRLDSSGREKQTDDSHLAPLPARRRKSKPAKRAKQPPKRNSTSTEYSYASEQSTEYSFTSEHLPGVNLISPNLQGNSSRDGKEFHSVQKKKRHSKAKQKRSMDGLSLSAHSASSQRSTEQTHQRSSLGAVPRSIPKSMRSPPPRRKSSSIQRNDTPEYRRIKGNTKKKRGMDGPRKKDGLSQSWHPASSRKPASSQRERSGDKPRRRTSLNPVPKNNSFLSPKIPQAQKNLGLDLSIHSANSRRSAEQPRRRSAMGNTIPLNLYLSPNTAHHARRIKVVKKKRVDGLSVSAHAAISQQQPRRRNSLIRTANARTGRNRELSQSMHSASSSRNPSHDSIKKRSKPRRRSTSSQRCTPSQPGSAERHPARRFASSDGALPAFVSPPRKRASKPSKTKSLEVPRSAPSTTNRRIVCKTNGIPKIVVLDIPSPAPTPTKNAKSKKKANKMNDPSPKITSSIFSKAKKLIKVG